MIGHYLDIVKSCSRVMSDLFMCGLMEQWNFFCRNRCYAKYGIHTTLQASMGSFETMTWAGLTSINCEPPQSVYLQAVVAAAKLYTFGIP